MDERKRGRDGKVIGMETIKMLSKLEGCIEMQGTIINTLERYIDSIDPNDNVIITFAKKQIARDMINIIKNVKPTPKHII
jgi:hypothetical protein